jgi:hypothetical protein
MSKLLYSKVEKCKRTNMLLLVHGNNNNVRLWDTHSYGGAVGIEIGMPATEAKGPDIRFCYRL